MHVIVNGAGCILPDNSSVTDLLTAQAVVTSFVVVEVNRSIVKKNAWETTRLNGGDRIEIVTFVGGG